MKTENSAKQVQVGTGIKVKSNVKAGGVTFQHNQTIARGLRVKSNVKAGRIMTNHNQTILCVA